jgi:hypothetical protein
MSREAMQQALEAQGEPVCWASRALLQPDDEDEAKGWEARVKSAPDAVFSVPLYAAPQPASAQGWVPAPPKATIQMLVAGRLALYHASMHDIEASETEMAEAWEAMMAARPQPKETT